MSEFFSSDGPYLLQFLVIFLVILVLLMGAWLLFNRIVGRGLSRAARAGNRARQPRLGIVDIYELDRQRQLILLRRDNVEHLLLVGGPNDVVVERNVVRGAAARLPGDALARPEPAADMLSGPLPGPLGAPLTGSLPGFAPAAFAPSSPEPPPFAMPVVVPPPGTNGQPTGSGAGRPPPLDPALFEPEAEPAGRSRQPPGGAPADASAGAPTKPLARSRIGIAQVGRILRRTPPPLVGERAEPASERARAGAPDLPAFAPTLPPTLPPTSLPAALPPTSPPSEPRPVDPAVLSDMARQLETALRRPSSAVTPPPGPPAGPAPRPTPEPSPLPPPEPAVPPAPAPEPEAPHPVPDPVAAGMAASQALNPPAPPPEPPADAQARDEPRPAGQPGGTPFTVEEIETEFARLLGRPLDKKT